MTIFVFSLCSDLLKQLKEIGDLFKAEIITKDKFEEQRTILLAELRNFK